MGRKKHIRYQENREQKKLIQYGHPLFDMIKGSWSDSFFDNYNPIVLELACGKGEYSTQLANIYPQNNYIGIDIKGDRLRYGIQEMEKKQLTNVGFLRTTIHHLDNFFSTNEVSDIRLVQPDPRPKSSDEKRRLTHHRFLTMYRDILQPDGLLRLKTDDADLFDYSLATCKAAGRELIDKTRDLYHSPLREEHHGIITKYEQQFVAKGKTIHYAKRQNRK